jgi:single-strand DNA-binding protein
LLETFVTLSAQTRHDFPATFPCVNVVSLIGHLATDVELRRVGADKKVAGFLLAVQRPGKDSDADFVWVNAWDRQAELCAEYLAKGRRVGVDGRLRSRSWEEDGKRRRAVEVVATRVEFLSPPPEEAEIIPFDRAAAG